MFNISGFLEKFKKFGQDRVLKTENILKSIEDVVGVKIPPQSITVKNGILRIHGSPTLRQEIFLKKEHLLSVVAKEGVLDIR